jgi:hypothetical protein
MAECIQSSFEFGRNAAARVERRAEMARTQVAIIHWQLLKVGAQIRITAGRVWVSMASS